MDEERSIDNAKLYFNELKKDIFEIHTLIINVGCGNQLR